MALLQLTDNSRSQQVCSLRNDTGFPSNQKEVYYVMRPLKYILHNTQEKKKVKKMLISGTYRICNRQSLHDVLGMDI